MADLRRIRLELIVENDRRYGGQKTERGREQRFRDAGRDNREIGVFGDCDGLEAGHDAPHRAEQADERRGRADGGKKQQPAVEPLHLAADGDVHHLLDAHLNAAQRADIALDRPLPFTHRGDEERAHGDGPPAREICVQLVQRLARQHLDRPAPDVGRHAVVERGPGLAHQGQAAEDPHRRGQVVLRRAQVPDAGVAVQGGDRLGVLEPGRETGRMGQQVLHRDRARRRNRVLVGPDPHRHVGQFRDVAADGVLQQELTLLVALEEGQADDRLGHREDPEDRVLGDRPLVGHISPAVDVPEDLLAPVQDRGHRVREATRVHVAVGHGSHIGQTVGVDPPGRRTHAEHRRPDRRVTELRHGADLRPPLRPLGR